MLAATCSNASIAAGLAGRLPIGGRRERPSRRGASRRGPGRIAASGKGARGVIRQSLDAHQRHPPRALVSTTPPRRVSPPARSPLASARRRRAAKPAPRAETRDGLIDPGWHRPRSRARSGRERAAGHLRAWRCDRRCRPNPARETAGIADGPGVAISVGGTGLARGLDAVEDGTPGGAFLHHLAHRS